MRRLVCLFVLLAAFLLSSSAASAGDEPFGKAPTRDFQDSTPMIREWKSMPAKMQLDITSVALCRVDNMCSTGAKRAIELIDEARQLSMGQRLAFVNERVNQLVEYISDERQWGPTEPNKKSERWSSPLEILESQKGDCEEFANLKWFLLFHVGVPAEDMRLVQVGYPGLPQSHLLLTVLWRQKDSKGHEVKDWMAFDDRTLKTIARYEVMYVLWPYEISTRSTVAAAQAR
jgi:predicted transglutaminase-like cysteine proteinase